jgi:hypothetical protein
MQKLLIMFCMTFIFSSGNAMQMQENYSNENVLCACCEKPIDQDGKCLRFLKSLFGKMNAMRCPHPDCVVVFHPACLKKHLSSAHCDVVDSAELTLPSAGKKVIEKVVDSCALLALIPVELFCFATCSAGWGVMTFPAYYAGKKVIGNGFDIPFALGLIYGTGNMFALAPGHHFGVGGKLMAVSGLIVGLGAYVFDAWAFSKWC